MYGDALEESQRGGGDRESLLAGVVGGALGDR